MKNQRQKLTGDANNSAHLQHLRSLKLVVTLPEKTKSQKGISQQVQKFEKAAQKTQDMVAFTDTPLPGMINILPVKGLDDWEKKLKAKEREL